MLLLLLWTGLVGDVPRAQPSARKSQMRALTHAPEPVIATPTPMLEALALQNLSPMQHRTVQQHHSGQGRAVLHRDVTRIPLIRVQTAVVHGQVGARLIRQVVRRSLRPRVQDCFARERAGNPHWSGRAVLVLTIEGPAIGMADVETESEPLRRCILQGIDYLVFPSVDDGREHHIHIHYPFVSPARRTLLAPPLEEATDTLLNTVFRDEASTSPHALLASE